MHVVRDIVSLSWAWLEEEAVMKNIRRAVPEREEMHRCVSFAHGECVYVRREVMYDCLEGREQTPILCFVEGSRVLAIGIARLYACSAEQRGRSEPGSHLAARDSTTPNCECSCASYSIAVCSHFGVTRSPRRFDMLAPVPAGSRI